MQQQRTTTAIQYNWIQKKTKPRSQTTNQFSILNNVEQVTRKENKIKIKNFKKVIQIKFKKNKIKRATARKKTDSKR